MISPEKIPSYTGNLAELQHEVSRLRQAAREIRGHGHAVHARFQHLDASYKAPEAEQLFATTQAVHDTSGDVAGKLESVADALAGYADEAAVIVQRLESLRQKASAFVASVKDDQDPISGGWRHDQDKVDEHQALLDGVTAAVAAFQQAEVTAADKITALVHGTRWHINDGSPKQKNAYGFSAEQLAEAPKLPWGSPEHYWGTPFGIDYHLQEFGISLWDNVAGSVEGLVNLFSSGEEGDAAREGLGKVAMGLASYAVDPAGDRKDLDPTQRLYAPYRKDAKEFAKSFVAWDDWATNPGKAVGTVFYNGLTLASGPLGAVSKVGAVAGKAGAAARVAGTLAKVGEVMDPIGAAGKTIGVAARALPKLSEVTAGLRAATDAAAAADTPHSVIDLGNGAKVRIEDGQFFPSKDGQPNTAPAPDELPAGQRTPSVDAPRPAEPPSRHELVGAGAHLGDASSGGSPNQLGEHAPTGRAADHFSSGHADDLGHRPAASHETAAGQAENPGHGPSTGGHPGDHRDGLATWGEHHGSAPGGRSDGPSGEEHADRPDAGGHDGVTGVHSEGPMGPGHESAAGGHGGGPNGGEPGFEGTGEPDGPEGWELPSEDSGPFERGGESERQVQEQIDRLDTKQGDVPRILQNLAKDPAGQEIADTIASGRFNDSPNFWKVVSALSKADDIPGCREQIRLANRLYESGLTDISFEIKQGGHEIKPGVFTEDKTDLDLMARDSDGNVHGWQFKDMTGADSTTKPRKVVDKIYQNIRQLTESHADVQTFVVDTKVTKSELAAHIERLQKGYEGRGVQFVIRTPDGIIFVPRNGKFMPEGTL